MHRLLQNIYQTVIKYEIYNLLILAVGLWLRFQRVLTELVWGEEAIYLEIASSRSWVNLILARHWLIDHPQLYLVWSKIWSMLGTSPLWLRLPNLVVYVLSGMVVIKVGKLLFNSSLARTLLLSFYAFFPYFVGIEWQAVPYFFAIFFSTLSLYFSLVIMKFGSTKKEIWGLGISLTLFLYTSFEAIYFAGAVSFFVLFAWLLKLMPKEKMGALLKGLVLAGGLFLPEVLIVLSKMGEFLVLADKFETRGYETGVFLARLFALPQFNLAVYGAVGVGVLYGLWRKLKGKKDKVILLFLTTVLVVSALIIYAVSSYVIEVRHPRAYYYLVLVAMMLALKLAEGYGQINTYLKYGLWIGLLFLTARYCLTVNDNWKKARYAYAAPYSRTLVLREELVQFLQNRMDRSEKYRVVLGNNLTLGIWYEGVYLYDYYFKCLDLEDKSKCDVIQDAVLNVKGPEEVKNEKGQRLVGVFVSVLTIDYFVKEICPGQESCYIWDYDQVGFREIRGD